MRNYGQLKGKKMLIYLVFPQSFENFGIWIRLLG